MKGYSKWSYCPYRPPLTEVGDIYICRIVPAENAIHFEWLPLTEGSVYAVFYRERGTDDFLHWRDTLEPFCDIESLLTDTDYEFYVACGDQRSRVRLARCGKSVGCVVNYLHPEDEAYAFSGHYLCSPSLVRHPDGYLLASMDVFGHREPQNLTLIFRSDDEGESWHYVSELMPCFWGKLFIHKGELYMLSCSTEFGDLLIGKSSDGGKSFSMPITLLRGSNGKNKKEGVHKNPQNILRCGGRIWETLEWGSSGNPDYRYAAMVMSCDENDDLLVPENWSFSEPRRLDRFVPEMADLPLDTVTIEGTLTISPEGRLLNVMRHKVYHRALVYEVDTENPEGMLCFSRLMEFPANCAKFMIKHDEVSGYYYSVGTRVYDKENMWTRNLLSLLRSRDLKNWEVLCDLLDYREEDPKKIGFQYVDFEFENDDIVFLCRTAINDAHDYHDSNYSTFHRIPSFREIGTARG